VAQLLVHSDTMDRTDVLSEIYGSNYADIRNAWQSKFSVICYRQTAD